MRRGIPEAMVESGRAAGGPAEAAILSRSESLSLISVNCSKGTFLSTLGPAAPGGKPVGEFAGRSCAFRGPHSKKPLRIAMEPCNHMAGTVAVCLLNLIIVLSPLEDTQSEAV